MAYDGIAVAALFIASLGAVAEVLSLLSRQQTPTLTSCPNCDQPFDILRFIAVNGVRRVTCPRCRFTWTREEIVSPNFPERLGQEHVW